MQFQGRSFDGFDGMRGNLDEAIKLSSVGTRSTVGMRI